jgi:hypothetical protein
MVRGPDEELGATFATINRGRADAVVIQGSLSTKRIADKTRSKTPNLAKIQGDADEGY